MRHFFTLLVATISVTFNSYSQTLPQYSNDKPAYVIFNKSGEMVKYSDMIKHLQEAEVCLFGELHDDPISHWMEVNLVKDLYSIYGQKLVVGAEMWETDNQLLIDETFQGLVDGQSYVESSKLWPNFDTDYLPIIQFAKSKKLRFVATNVPRRYARIIYKKGIEYLDSLSPVAKSYLPPLPIHFNLEEGIYKDMARPFPTDEEYEASKAKAKNSKSPMTNGKPSNLVKAQAIKDATMAYFILKNMKNDSYFFHFNGELHSANNTAICFYLRHYKPNVRIKTISIVKQDNNLEFDKTNIRADFMIVIPNDMSVTYVK